MQELQAVQEHHEIEMDSLEQSSLSSIINDTVDEGNVSTNCILQNNVDERNELNNGIPENEVCYQVFNNSELSDQVLTTKYFPIKMLIINYSVNNAI